MLNRRFTLLLSGGILFLASFAAAEVSALLDDKGALVRLDVRSNPAAKQIWTKYSEIPEQQTLNMLGDLILDGAPTCGILSLPEDDPAHLTRTGDDGSQDAGDTSGTTPQSRKSAVVVWSRYDGEDFELLYSMWDPKAKAWRAPAYLERTDNGVDDLKPFVYVENNRIFAVWQKGTTPFASIGTPVILGGVPDVDWSPPVRVGPGLMFDRIDLYSLALTGGLESGGRSR